MTCTAAAAPSKLADIRTAIEAVQRAFDAATDDRIARALWGALGDLTYAETLALDAEERARIEELYPVA
jgi:hypothetical protein